VDDVSGGGGEEEEFDVDDYPVFAVQEVRRR
jgi:hypothetical protein